jgi:hypothetical protein
MSDRTEALIDKLAGELTPTPARALEKRIGRSLVAGLLISLLLMLAGLGLRHDLAAAVGGFALWMKLGYAAALAAIALPSAVALTRPDAPPPRRLWLTFLPILVIALLALGETLRTPPEGMAALWMGKTWLVCPGLLLSLALPILLALLRAARRLAPADPRVAGAAAGLAAGAFATLIYCLHCPESTAAFVLVWYSLGIGLSTLAGRLLGPRLLRW